MGASLLGLGLLLLCSCSAILDFSANGLACDVSDRLACLEGYTCNSHDPNAPVCVADRSLKGGASCKFDRQCSGDLICPTGLDICLTPCDVAQSYVPDRACPSGFYCRPQQSVAMFSDAQPHTPTLVAACLASEGCVAGQQCASATVPQGGICANMGSATACVVGCETKFTANVYADNCGKDTNGNARFCQPLGPGAGQFVFACLDAGSSPQPIGSPCQNPVSQPCAPGLGCIKNVCRNYCDLSLSPAASCAPGLTPCDLHANASQLIGYCTSDPSCQ